VNIATLDINFSSEKLTLTNQRALYWQKHSVLIISDLHIGKTAHFRRHGIPVTYQVLEKDLTRLAQLIVHFKAKQIIIVGDLFHADNNTDIKLFKNWINNFTDLNWILVKGNHDRFSKSITQGLDFDIFHTYELNPFVFIHDFNEKYSDEFTISGHIHPGIFIKGKGRQRIKLPCFQVSENQLILPAFSLFTGLNTKTNTDTMRIYVFTDEEIFEF